MNTPKELSDRISNYLQAGGLFNPELMEADKVRDLLMDCRECFDNLPKPLPPLGYAEEARNAGFM